MHDLIDSLKRSKKGGPKFFFHFTVFDRVTGIVHKFFAIFFLQDRKILNFGFNSIFPFFLEEIFTGAAFFGTKIWWLNFTPAVPILCPEIFREIYLLNLKNGTDQYYTHIELRTFFCNFRRLFLTKILMSIIFR